VKSLLLVLSLLSAPVFAMPVLECLNSGTGAKITVGVYPNQPPYFEMSDPLLKVLVRQGAGNFIGQGVGGIIQRGANLRYDVQLENGAWLNLYPQNGGWHLAIDRLPGFDFNPGECRNTGI
jgi:hypothetical protein